MEYIFNLFISSSNFFQYKSKHMSLHVDLIKAKELLSKYSSFVRVKGKKIYAHYF